MRITGKGCLIALASLVALGFFFFKTEPGWTLFYSFGHFGPDMRALVTDNGLQPRSMTARLRVGSRNGYAWIYADDAELEKFRQALLSKGLVEYPDPKTPPEDRPFAVNLAGAPDGERERYRQALIQGQARAVKGAEVRHGDMKDFLFIYLPGENRGLLLGGYPYG